MLRKFIWIPSLILLVDSLLTFSDIGKSISMVDVPTFVSIACGTIVSN